MEFTILEILENAALKVDGAPQMILKSPHFGIRDYQDYGDHGVVLASLNLFINVFGKLKSDEVDVQKFTDMHPGEENPEFVCGLLYNFRKAFSILKEDRVHPDIAYVALKVVKDILGFTQEKCVFAYSGYMKENNGEEILEKYLLSENGDLREMATKIMNSEFGDDHDCFRSSLEEDYEGYDEMDPYENT